MAPIELTRPQVIRSKSAIIDFARTYIYTKKLAGLAIDRPDVITMWRLNTKRFFAHGDPKYEKIMDQVRDLSNSIGSSS